MTHASLSIRNFAKADGTSSHKVKMFLKADESIARPTIYAGALHRAGIGDPIPCCPGGEEEGEQEGEAEVTHPSGGEPASVGCGLKVRRRSGTIGGWPVTGE